MHQGRTIIFQFPTFFPLFVFSFPRRTERKKKRDAFILAILVIFLLISFRDSYSLRIDFIVRPRIFRIMEFISKSWRYDKSQSLSFSLSLFLSLSLSLSVSFKRWKTRWRYTDNAYKNKRETAQAIISFTYHSVCEHGLKLASILHVISPISGEHKVND